MKQRKGIKKLRVKLKELKGIAHTIHNIQSLHRKKNILKLAVAGQHSLGITGDEWDLDPYLLACKNGVIDLKTGGFRPGKPEDYIKTFAPAEWKGLEFPLRPGRNLSWKYLMGRRS